DQDQLPGPEVADRVADELLAVRRIDHVDLELGVVVPAADLGREIMLLPAERLARVADDPLELRRLDGALSHRFLHVSVRAPVVARRSDAVATHRLRSRYEGCCGQRRSGHPAPISICSLMSVDRPDAARSNAATASSSA